jgi:hypothetical protein
MVEPRSRGAGRDTERLGDFGELVAEMVVEDDDGAMLGRELAEGGLELVARDDRGRHVGRFRSHAQHTNLGDVASLAARLDVARVHDEPVEPGIESLDVTKRGQVAPGAQQRLLDSVLRPMRVAQDPVGEGVAAIDAGRGD